MSQDAYRIIPSPSGVSALQSRSKDQVTVLETDYGYTLDNVHAPELIRPQLYFITYIEPIYVRNIQVSPEAITRVAEAHSDIYIIHEEVVYIDPTIYTSSEITWYTQQLLIVSYRVQRNMR